MRVFAQQEFVLVVAGDTLMDLREVCMQDVCYMNLGEFILYRLLAVNSSVSFFFFFLLLLTV